MIQHIKMGTHLVSDYPLQKMNGHYRFAKASKMPYNEDLKGGVLVRQNPAEGEGWKPVDAIDSSAGLHNLSAHYGVWHDRGWIFRNGKIEIDEVKPMHAMFSSQRILGWTGIAPGIGCHLVGIVSNAWFESVHGQMGLALDTPVTRKIYTQNASADLDSVFDSYVQMDEQNDRCGKNSQ
jgi:hypothetical protein